MPYEYLTQEERSIFPYLRILACIAINIKLVLSLPFFSIYILTAWVLYVWYLLCLGHLLVSLKQNNNNKKSVLSNLLKDKGYVL